mgnify:CR=1 FL=1
MEENNTEIVVSKTNVKIAEAFGYSNAEVQVIASTVAKGTNGTELSYFLNVCKSVGLNPFVKEIWCYKDNKGNLLIFAGRDGFLAKAQVNPFFNGIRSSEVCKNDVFSIDIANNKIEHKFGIAERGGIVGAYAIVFRKNGEPTIEYVDFNLYNKGYNTWKTHPHEMIKKVAETHALKKAFGISGIQSEYDFQEKNGIVIPINSESEKYSLEVLKNLYDEKINLIPENEIENIVRIIDNEEKLSYKKVIDQLNKL